MFKKIFLLNIIFLLIFIFLLEVIARFFQLSDLTGISKNLLIYENNIQKNAPNIEASAFSKKVYTDNFGFRVPNKNYRYSNESSSVLILGDSVSFGVGVEEHETFVGLLRKEFKELNFFNSSVSGYHLKHYPFIIEENKNLDKLNEIIFFLTLNDISFEKTLLNVNEQIKKEISNKKINFFNKLKENIYFTKLNIFLRNKSKFYMWAKGVITKPSERHFNYTFPLYQDKHAVNEVNKELEKLKIAAHKNNFNLYVVILPYEFQTRPENCNINFLTPQFELKNILNNLNIKFKDYTEIFCKNKKPSSLFLKFDPVHLSIKGHSLVFNLLRKDLNYLQKY